MTSNEIIKRLTSEGWLKAGGKGDHEKFKHPEKPVMSWCRIREKILQSERCEIFIDKLAGTGRNDHAVPRLRSSW